MGHGGSLSILYIPGKFKTEQAQDVDPRLVVPALK